ncbi:sulfurase [Dictyobacter alpinus]|uniref:Sulfurase n=1 Tax=Dictyobacter alpinus TaxID=2014873 RepID=A0A402BK46_9CHLR|nr:MOSC and FAD-binding oxidoreductase domain-containing protein [Dictyobacter alpinus]GCE31715.1 sulfurase [Dictyobacter alpinus]
MAQLLSVNVGLPRDITWHGETVHTAVWKESVQGKQMVRRLNIDGDGQGDLGGHGGEQRAVFVYQTASYRYWEQQLGRNDFVFGQFGENFTIDGLADDEVCIGDRYRIGHALFEVTQPRVTCYRVGIRMDEPRMAALLVAHGRPGFYFRVLEEGEVEAGDEIIKVATSPEHMTVAEINALLYLSGHSREQLERALRIPALSPGWKQSFRSLLEQVLAGNTSGGNAGLAATSRQAPAWQGFRPLKVERIERESNSVLSLVLKSADQQPLSAALPGQFIVLRLHPHPDAAPLLRNYSLSNAPDAHEYRVSVKLEDYGVASKYIHSQVQVGDILDVSAPRGTFTYNSYRHGVVVLLSAGVGATPVLSMLHALTTEKDPVEVWWLYGARNHSEHPFAQEAQLLLEKLSNSHRHILYSRPESQDRLGQDFDAPGHLSVAVMEELGVPRNADFYLCGPQQFLQDLTAGLTAWGVTSEHLHSESFGPGTALNPGVVKTAARTPHQPAGATASGPLISFARSGLAVHWDPAFQSILELAEACDVPVRWSCRTGVCHNCESGLIAGRVSYQPDPLEPPADGNLLICCSRPEGEIVVDL